MYRILHIIPTLDRSGAEKQLALLAAGLPRDEFEVHVAALTRGGPLAADLANAKIPLTLIGKRWKLDPAAYLRLERHVAALQPDLVHTWLFAGNSYGRVAAMRAGVRRIVAAERCVDLWKSWHEFAIDRRLARRTDRIVVNSSAIAEFGTRHGLPADKFVVIPNGVSPLPADDTPRTQLLAELGLPDNARLIGTIGRLWPQKRMKDLIWAVDLLKVLRDDVHLLIIGEGPQRENLERYRRLVRVEDKVHFLGHRADVHRLLPHFDLLALASGYEGLPNVVMEALVTGVPVVASDIPGNRELVVDDECGYLVPVGDRAGIARKALKILNDPALRDRLGAAGRQRMLDKFGVPRMVERQAALYRELLS